MQSDHSIAQLEAVAGQTDMAPYVSLRDQRNMQVPVFLTSQVHIAARIPPLLDRQALAAAEDKTLAVLRDRLLPKLISGELRVKGAERLAQAGV
jgi:type I restriction enzyme S subunit